MNEIIALRNIHDSLLRRAAKIAEVIKEMTDGEESQPAPLFPEIATSGSKVKTERPRRGPVDENLLDAVIKAIKERGRPMSADELFRALTENSYEWRTDQQPRIGFGISLANAAKRGQLTRTVDRRGRKIYGLPEGDESL